MNEHDAGTATTLPADVRDGVFVVIPAFNEGSCLEKVVAGVRAEYRHAVVVDDGSTDDSYEAARRSTPFVLRHLVNRGQGAALQTGIEFALRRGAKVVVTFDSDGQHRVEDIQRIVEPLSRGECDIALGSRFLEDASAIPPIRRLTLRMGVLFTRFVSRVRLTDTHNGLRGFTRRAALRLDIRLDRMAHASELIDFVRHSGLPYREVPVRVDYTAYSRQKGQSSRQAFKIVIQYVLGRVMP